MTFKFDRWHWKTIGHLSYVTSKFFFFFSHVTLKLDRWPWKTLGHLIYATSSFVHHLISISESKLQLQSGNTWFGSTCCVSVPIQSSTVFNFFPGDATAVGEVFPSLLQKKKCDFLSCVTLKFDGWPSKTIAHLSYVTPNFEHQFLWPWHFAWTSLLSMVITLVKIWWCYDKRNIRCDRQMDEQTHRWRDGLKCFSSGLVAAKNFTQQ